MIEKNAEFIARESVVRLTQAEQSGLRLALACRTLITGAAFIWYVLAAILFPEMSPRLATIAVLLGFTAVGVAHVAVIGTRYDRAWIKYAIYALDALAICAAFALVPISRADEVPQIIAFRAYGIYFLFPLVAMACLSLSWRLVLWTGGMIVLGWWLAFAWVVARMENVTSWSDMPSAATRADYETVFLSIDFIGRGNRMEETGMVFFATIALALAVYRARSVFFAQVAADVELQREKSLREHISDLLGKQVPETIAQQLIADDAPLKPQRSHGTALVLDIADFTAFSEKHEPEHVIERLDDFFADATRIVSQHGGIVISYLGDGFLATFNAPVTHETPQAAAVATGLDMQEVARRHGFSLRIGVASGNLVTGIIGNQTRQSFTVYGNAVNLASRLESLCKELNEPLVMDEATRTAVIKSIQTRSLGMFSVRGLENQISLYAPDLTVLLVKPG